MRYSELRTCNSIQQLLPQNPDAVFLLYENSPCNGHWVVLTRDRANNINYFDSYGGYIDEPLTWETERVNTNMNQDHPYLSCLLDNTPEKTFYNNIDYQGQSRKISTCGRHAVMYVHCMLKEMSLEDYYKYMVALKKRCKCSFDDIVCKFISRI